MKFPRVHLFVDAKCPALVSGKITGWAAPSKLVAMLGPRDAPQAPPGAIAARALRLWRSGLNREELEVQIVLEGPLTRTLSEGLGESVRDVFQFNDVQSLVKGDFFEGVVESHLDFRNAVSEVSIAFEILLDRIEGVGGHSSALDVPMFDEIAAVLDGAAGSVLDDRINCLAKEFLVSSSSSGLGFREAA